MRSPPDGEMRRARLVRDSSYDGIFWIGLRTTRIFCRPSCPAKQPREENVVYFTSVSEAAAADFRACHRCRPTQTDGRPPEWVRAVLALSDERLWERLVDRDLRSAGVDPARVRRYFRRHYGRTFHAYHRARRMASAAGRLEGGAGVLDAGLEHGYESASGFHDAFVRQFGVTPGTEGPVRHIVIRSLESPVGRLDLGATDRGICLLEFSDRRALPTEIETLEKRLGCPVVPGNSPYIEQMAGELERYFARTLTRFSTPLDVTGTPFQMAVWAELLKIPYGETISYGELARRVGRPGAQRAVGTANGANRIAIAIPCHRVVQRDASLRGYGGGLWRKRLLLDLESGQRAIPDGGAWIAGPGAAPSACRRDLRVEDGPGVDDPGGDLGRCHVPSHSR